MIRERIEGDFHSFIHSSSATVYRSAPYPRYLLFLEESRVGRGSVSGSALQAGGGCGAQLQLQRKEPAAEGAAGCAPAPSVASHDCPTYSYLRVSSGSDSGCLLISTHL